MSGGERYGLSPKVGTNPEHFCNAFSESIAKEPRFGTPIAGRTLSPLPLFGFGHQRKPSTPFPSCDLTHCVTDAFGRYISLERTLLLLFLGTLSISALRRARGRGCRCCGFRGLVNLKPPRARLLQPGAESRRYNRSLARICIWLS